MAMGKRNTPETFWANVDKSAGADQCWPWTMYRTPLGYGQVRYQGECVLAHRLAFILTNGPIASELVVMHICDSPPCCNPLHLRVGTQTDNVADMMRKGRGNWHNPRGEEHPRAKVTRQIVDQIREMHRQGGHSCSSLARQFGLHHSQISNIVRGKSWR